MPSAFLPPDPALHLDASTTGTQIEYLLGGAQALPRMLADIRSVAGPGSFVYHSAWNCEVDLAVANDNLRSALSGAAAAGAQLRLLLWSGVDSTAALAKLILLSLSNPLMAAANYSLIASVIGNVGLLSAIAASHNEVAAALVNGLPPAKTDALGYLDAKTLLAGSHHQKILLAGTDSSVVAYIGGIEFSTDRLYSRAPDGTSIKGAPLFDVSVRVTGTAAYAILKTFTDRWTAAAPRALQTPALRGLGRTAPPLPSTVPSLSAQVTHTYGKSCPYPVAITTAGRAISAAIGTSEQFIYMEDQYYVGTPDLAAAISGALKSSDTRWAVVVIAADESVTDLPDVVYRRHAMLGPLVSAFPGRFLVFERIGNDKKMTGPTAYVHSKLTIVDDVVAVIGSANSNYRSWTHDSEVMLTLADTSGPGGLDSDSQGPLRAMRSAIWQQHLTPIGGSLVDVTDPEKARALWTAVWNGTATAHVRAYRPLTPAARPSWMLKLPAIGEWLWQNVIDPRV